MTTPTVPPARPEPDVLQTIIGYCRLSQELAEEGVGPEADGLARAYADVADRLQQRLDALTARSAQAEP